MAKIRREKMSDYLRENLPDGFYLEANGDDFLYLKYSRFVVAVFNQMIIVSEKSIVEEAIKYKIFEERRRRRK